MASSVPQGKHKGIRFFGAAHWEAIDGLFETCGEGSGISVMTAPTGAANRS